MRSKRCDAHKIINTPRKPEVLCVGGGLTSILAMQYEMTMYIYYVYNLTACIVIEFFPSSHKFWSSSGHGD